MNLVDSSVEHYLDELYPIEDELLADIYRYGRDQGIPIMQLGAMRHLAFISLLLKPQVIIEVGTAIGFSAIWLAKANEQAIIHTIERDPAMVEIAQANVERAGLAERIIIHEGEANELLAGLPRCQLVFVDAAKGKYREFYELAYPLVDRGGLFVFDNVLFRGYVADEAEAKSRPMLRKLREFNEFLAADKRVATDFIAIGDGLALARKLEE